MTLGKATSAAAQMVMLLFLARTLEAENLAVLLAVYSIASVVAALGDLGLGTLGMRELVYGDPRKSERVFALASKLAIIAAALGLVTFGAASLFIPLLFPCLPLLLWGPIERATENRSLRLIADGRSAKVSLLNGARRLSSLVLFLLLARFVEAAFAFSFSLLISSVLFHLLICRWSPASRIASSSSPWALLREASPFTFTSLSGQMRNLDVPLVTSIIGGSSAAAYGLGARLASPVMLIYSSVSSLILVRTRTFTSRKVLTLVSTLLSVSTLLAIGISINAHSFALLLTPYVPWLTLANSQVLLIVTCSYLFAGTSILLGSMLVAYGKQKILMSINVLTATTSLVSVWLFSSLTGSAHTAAVASLCCYVFQAVALTFLIFVHHRNLKETHNA